MYGGLLIDGYDFKKDIGPKGSIAFDEKSGQFRGSYTGLKMPPGRRAIFAWLYDSVNQKAEYVGPVGWLKKGASGKEKGRFRIPVADKYKDGDFGSYEIIAFSAEYSCMRIISASTPPTTRKKSEVTKYMMPIRL